MSSSAVLGFGTTLSRNGNVIAELTKIDTPEITMSPIDVTSHQSPGNFSEYIPGRLEAGDVAIEGNFIPGDANGQLGLYADLYASTLQSFVISFPATTGTTWTFSAYVTKFKAGQAAIDDKIPFTASLRITGQPTLGVTLSAGLTTPFLTPSTGTLIPAAAQATLVYVLEAVTGTSSITLTPTASAGVITITANGASQVVTSGQASTAIALGAAGSITVVTISVKETGKSAKVYTLNVARAAS
jgi:hypothetical protein